MTTSIWDIHNLLLEMFLLFINCLLSGLLQWVRHDDEPQDRDQAAGPGPGGGLSRAEEELLKESFWIVFIKCETWRDFQVWSV